MATLPSALRKLTFAAIAAFGAAALWLPSAQAALLGDFLPGLVSPADSASSCDTNSSEAFARWGDDSNYVLMPGGSFEYGGPSWTLAGGARVVYGNEPYYVHSREDRFALYLPAGSSATTPPMCFDFGDWHLRTFAVSSSASAQLKVTVIVKSLVGTLSVLDGGRIDGTSRWTPSDEVSAFLSNVGGLVSTDTISFRFTPLDGGAWRLDDAYLDPFKET